MRRLLHHLFTLCSALSLLLCVAVCVLWARGGSTTDVIYFWHGVVQTVPPDGTNASPGFVMIHGGGWSRVRHIAMFSRNPDVPGRRWKLQQFPIAAQQPGLDRRLGFGAQKRTFGPLRLEWNRSEWNLYVPDYLPALATALLPLGWTWTTARRWRKSRDGLCPSCGYDLRESPERCPECGTKPVVSA